MRDERIKVGAVVQVNEKQETWSGCTVIVDEIKPFGVQAYLKFPMRGNAYVRLNWDEIEYVGPSLLVTADEEQE